MIIFECRCIRLHMLQVRLNSILTWRLCEMLQWNMVKLQNGANMKWCMCDMLQWKLMAKNDGQKWRKAPKLSKIHHKSLSGTILHLLMLLYMAYLKISMVSFPLENPGIFRNKNRNIPEYSGIFRNKSRNKSRNIFRPKPEYFPPCLFSTRNNHSLFI